MISDISQFSETMKEQLYDQFIRELRLRGYSDATVKTYGGYVGKLFDSCLPVKDFLMAYSHCSSSTIRLVYFSIERFYRFILGEDLTTAVPITKRRRKLPSIISREDIARLMDAAKGRTVVEIVIKGLYYSGMRVGEMSALKWDDIDFNRNMIHIKKTKGYKDRVVFLHPVLKDDLLNFRPIPSESICDNVFTFENGRPLTTRTIQYFVNNTRKKAGFTFSISPHTLRHAFAVHLIDGGASFWDVKEAMGHKQLRTTLKYTRLSNRDFNKMRKIL